MLALTILLLVVGASCVRHSDQQVLSDISRPSKYSVQTPPLDTIWTHQVGTNPWPQYPRPKLRRSSWQSLNGIWTYSNASNQAALKNPPFNQTLSHEVLVPSCLESGLSGIQGSNTFYSWYRTSFTVPKTWKRGRVILNFGAVDYEATVFVNGKNATFHRGGYFEFSVDITNFLSEGQNELIVFAFDPTDSGDYIIPLGKQTLKTSHIFYRPCSGIWQSVWIESVPQEYITSLYINGDARGQVNLTLETNHSKNDTVEITVFDRGTGELVATYNGTARSPNTFTVKSPSLWSPDVPTLYDVRIKMKDDLVVSYTGFRTISKEVIHGASRVLLNGKAIFPFGTLDQGYWPDGLYTPPNYEAMTFDIKTLKSLGYNMLRKHIKVEPALYYAAADELGILIMQDMPSLKTKDSGMPNRAQQAEFERQLGLLVEQLKSYTSIFAWVIYNEGWGQITRYYPEFNLSANVRAADPTRLVNAVSGWHDHGAGEFSDNHHYSSPRCGTPWTMSEPSAVGAPRIAFQGEFGGTGHNVSEEHLWKVKEAVDSIDETYEMYKTLQGWNSRSQFLLKELLLQVQLYSCAGAVWTQTTDVEGEVNGMMTYDRRLLRANVEQWKGDIQALYDAAARRSHRLK